MCNWALELFGGWALNCPCKNGRNPCTQHAPYSYRLTPQLLKQYHQHMPQVGSGLAIKLGFGTRDRDPVNFRNAIITCSVYVAYHYYFIIPLQRSWDIALGPIKQVPMNLFMMWMAGNSISIFPIMMVGMMAVRPIQAFMSLGDSKYSNTITKSSQWMLWSDPM